MSWDLSGEIEESHENPEAVTVPRFETGTSEYEAGLLFIFPCRSDYGDRTCKDKWSKIMT